MLADPRSLEALDFARVRERVAGQTHAAQAHVRALAMEPNTDTGIVRRLVTETTEMRALVRSQNFSLSRIEDVEASLEIAERGSSLPAGELRAIADALASGGAAVRAIREAEGVPALRDRHLGVPRAAGASSPASPTPSTSAAACSTAPRPSWRACDAKSRTRKTTRATAPPH